MSGSWASNHFWAKKYDSFFCGRGGGGGTYFWVSVTDCLKIPGKMMFRPKQIFYQDDQLGRLLPPVWICILEVLTLNGSLDMKNFHQGGVPLYLMIIVCKINAPWEFVWHQSRNSLQRCAASPNYACLSKRKKIFFKLNRIAVRVRNKVNI